jgi:hypothetical protein
MNSSKNSYLEVWGERQGIKMRIESSLVISFKIPFAAVSSARKPSENSSQCEQSVETVENLSKRYLSRAQKYLPTNVY